MQLVHEGADEQASNDDYDPADLIAGASNRNDLSSTQKKQQQQQQQPHEPSAEIESAESNKTRMKGNLTATTADQSDPAAAAVSPSSSTSHFNPSTKTPDTNKSSISEYTAVAAAASPPPAEPKQDERSNSFFQTNNVPIRARVVGFFMFLILLMLVLIAIYGIKDKTTFNLGYFSLGREGTNLADVMKVFYHQKGSILLDVTTSNTDNVYQSKINSRRLASAWGEDFLFGGDYTTDDASSSSLTSHVQLIDQMVDSRSLAYNQYHVPFDHESDIDGTTFTSDTAGASSSSSSSSGQQRQQQMTTFSTASSTNHHVDYKVIGCWGISMESSKYIDKLETPSFHLRNFQKYLTDASVRPNKLGIVEDFEVFCKYIIKNRDYLDIHPGWQESECIYNTFYNTYSKSKVSVNDAFIAMAQSYKPFGDFIGVKMNSTTVSTAVEWVCTNVSLRTSGTTSLYDDVSFGLKLQERWNDAFQTYGGTFANKYNIPIVVSSSEFTYPLVGRHIRNSLWVCAVVIIIGTYFAMLCLFSFEFVLTLLTGLSMITVFIFTVYMGLLVISWRIDLGTLIALNIMVPLSIVFPLYMSYQILTCDDLHEEKIGLHKPSSSYENYDLFYYRYLLEDVIQMPPHAVRAVLASNLSLLQPLFLSIIAGVSFIRSDFKALQKIGYWFILCALTSYVYTALVLPLLLMLPCKTNCCGDRCRKRDKGPAAAARRRRIVDSTDQFGDEYYEPYYQNFQVVKNDLESIPVEDELRYAGQDHDGRNIYRQLADRRDIIGRYYGSSMVAGPEQSVMYRGDMDMDMDGGMDRRGFVDQIGMDEGYEHPDSYRYDHLSYSRRSPYHDGMHHSPPPPMDLPGNDITNRHMSLQYHEDPLFGREGGPPPSSYSSYPLSDQYDHLSYGNGNGSNGLTYEQSIMLQQYPFAANNFRGSQSMQDGRNYLPYDPTPLSIDYSLSSSSRYQQSNTNASSTADYSSRYYDEPTTSNYYSSYEPSGIASRTHVSYRRPPAAVKTSVKYPPPMPMPMHSSMYSSSQYSASDGGNTPTLQQSNYTSSYHPSENTFHSDYQSSQTNSEYLLTAGSTYYDRQSTINKSIILPSQINSFHHSRHLGTNTDDDDDDDGIDDYSSIPQSLPRDRGATLVPRPAFVQRGFI